MQLYGLKPLDDSARRVRENTTLIAGGAMARQLLMQDKTVLITGASSGVGLGCALHMAEQGARVAMVCRDHMRGSTARAEVAKYAAGPDPLLFFADLSSQAEIHELSQEIHGQFESIDVVLNNAGAIFAHRELTCDHIERTFATNHLAPFLLTHLLFDLVLSAPAGRIVNVASEFHGSLLDFNNLQGERSYNFFSAYNRSKLCNILFTYELARRVAGSTVTVNCVSPGPTVTRFGDNMSGLPALIPFVMKRIPFLLGDPRYPEQGAKTLDYAASSPSLEGVSGRFFLRRGERPTKPITYDENVARRLWSVSEELCATAWDGFLEMLIGEKKHDNASSVAAHGDPV